MTFVSMSLSKKQKVEYAKVLYTIQQLTQKETAERVGISQKTMCAWVNKYKWDELRASLIISKDQELKRIYAQINELNNSIQEREQGKRYATSKEADILSKLASTAKSLESDMGISEYVSAFTSFTDWLREAEPAKAKDFLILQDQFIQTRL
jgi:DNA-binding XRE family transcriptional regulator